jgi:hypothetical protein
MRAKCPAFPILLDFITRTIVGETQTLVRIRIIIIINVII